MKIAFVKSQQSYPHQFLTNQWNRFFAALPIAVYRLDDNQSLVWPRFFVPRQPHFDSSLYFAVSQTGSSGSDYNKIADQLETPVAVLTQLPDPSSDVDQAGWHDLDSSYEVVFPGCGGGDCNHCFTQCPHCGLLGFQFNARAERLRCGCCDEHETNNALSRQLRLAYRLAQEDLRVHSERHLPDQQY